MENWVDGMKLAWKAEGDGVPGFPIMSYGPRFFSESFLDGHLVLKNFTLT